MSQDGDDGDLGADYGTSDTCIWRLVPVLDRGAVASGPLLDCVGPGGGSAVALEPGRAVRLARALRNLRVSEWPEVDLTQTQLATALSADSRVAAATLSSWESLSNPKTPTPARLSAYARFFATKRSLDGGPHLIPEAELTTEERKRYGELEERLLGLIHASEDERRSLFSFDEGPVTIVCPEVPEAERGPLADTSNPNFNRLQLFADLDALLEMWGHVRAENPNVKIGIRLPAEVDADDFSGHVILLGGIAWNRVTRRFQAAISQVPITQVGDPEFKTGDIFTVEETSVERFYPEWEELPEGGRELVEDVALIIRLRNPFQSSRTLTICNGVHSRGVFGAVRCLTDKQVRDANERSHSWRNASPTAASPAHRSRPGGRETRPSRRTCRTLPPGALRVALPGERMKQSGDTSRRSRSAGKEHGDHTYGVARTPPADVSGTPAFPLFDVRSRSQPTRRHIVPTVRPASALNRPHRVGGRDGRVPLFVVLCSRQATGRAGRGAHRPASECIGPAALSFTWTTATPFPPNDTLVQRSISSPESAVDGPATSVRSGTSGCSWVAFKAGTKSSFIDDDITVSRTDGIARLSRPSSIPLSDRRNGLPQTPRQLRLLPDALCGG